MIILNFYHINPYKLVITIHATTDLHKAEK